MPAPSPLPQKLQIVDLQGVNIERGVLVRPPSSFATLENFDLVKPGVIRKCKGNKKLTLSPALAPIVAQRDFQTSPTGPEILICVDALGNLYTSGMVDDPIALSAPIALYTPASLLTEAPFIVSLPFKNGVDRQQYAIITVGTKGQPVKFDGSVVTELGIENPTDEWTEDYQHSATIPQDFNTVAGSVIYTNTTPNPAQGVPISVGRRIRWSWYNPTTKHDSSLAGLNQGQYPTDRILGPTAGATVPNPAKPAGTVVTVNIAPYVMQYPIFLENKPTSFAFTAITPPTSGYTKMRFWATRDGGTEYYLLNRLFNIYGLLLTDDEGAIDLTSLSYGVESFTGNVGTETVVLDGFIPRFGASIATSVPFDEAIEYTVDGAGQTGTNLIVDRASANTIARGQFILDGDPNIYAITNNIALGGSSFGWVISPAITTAPADNAKISFLFTLPIPDSELLQQFADSTGINSDRENDPPPQASWGVVYQNRLFLLDATDKTRLVYSRIGRYESFPPDNVFRFIQADYDPITALLAGRQVGLVSEGADQRLVIGKPRSTAAITGTDISDFTLGHLFPETGIVHKRAAIVISGSLLALTRRGLELLEEQRPVFIGSYIKDIVDEIDVSADDYYGPCFGTDRSSNILLLGVARDTIFPPSPGDVAINTIIMMREPRYNQDGSLASPFSMYTALPEQLGCIHESGFGPDIRILVGTQTGDIYQLFTGGVNETVFGSTPVSAVADTQELPQDEKETRKIFRRIRFEGNLINEDTGWNIQFSTDGGVNFTPERRMYGETLIGLVGKQLVCRIIHNREVEDDEDPPMISNFSLYYNIIGEARDLADV